MSAMEARNQRRWVQQWNEATQALEQQRRSELRALSPDRALAASEALLALATPGQLVASRRSDSGLVEQQRLFLRRRPQ
jgi:hypothetical protein